MAQDTLTLDQEVVDLMTAGSALLEKAAADEQRRTEQEKQADELIPQVVDALIVGGFTPESNRTKLAKVLRDPINRLELLIEVSQFDKQAAAPAIGRPIAPAVKAAAARPEYREGALTDSPGDMALKRHFPGLFSQVG